MLQVSYRGLALVRTALKRVVGGVQPLTCDVAVVPADLWQATVRGRRVPQGETQPRLATLEWSGVRAPAPGPSLCTTRPKSGVVRRSPEQVSAVHQVITSELVPYAHFALFGPPARG